ncbi:methyl-accepting chemotaxis sensory transducer with GAF sensor [Stanieria sp. NIES-3757]|nr:methyl-accepting chemotaxis sensory transducer with GAF sensor [Stanieria sp. NIES-3757]
MNTANTNANSNPANFTSQQDALEKIKNNVLKQTRERLRQVIQTIRQASDERENLLINTVTAIREELAASRVLIYQFEDDKNGKVIMESGVTDWTPMQNETLPCLCFGVSSAIDYQEKEIVAISQVKQTRLTAYQQQLLEKFQVQASLALPICLTHQKVWGLLIIHQCNQARKWQEEEINLLCQWTNELTIALQPLELRWELQQQLEREKATAKVIEKIQQSQDLSDIFRTATQEVKKLLKCDRVIVYQFNSDWTGLVVAESVGSGWVSLLVEQNNDQVLSGDRIQLDRCLLRDWSKETKGDIVEPDSFLKQTQGGRYTRGQKFTAVDNIYTKDFPDCYIQSLEKYQAKAYLIVPIFQKNKLWGLLGAYQNDATQVWQESEINLMLQIATPLAVAIQRAEFISDLEAKTQQDQAVNQIVDRIRHSLKLTDIFRNATQEVKKILKSDRVIVYRFNPDWSGEVVAESLNSQWVSVMEIQETDETLYSTEMSADDRCTLKYLESGSALDSDTYFMETQGGKYTKGKKFQVVNDVYQAGFSACYLQSLEKYQAKAYIIVPLFQEGQLWGLLATYQNDAPRTWKKSEVDLMLKIAPQLSIALQQTQKSEQLAKTVVRQKTIARMVDRMQQAPTVEEVVDIATKETRKLLGVELTTIYRFNSDWSGKIIAEVTANADVKSLKAAIANDAYLQKNQGGRYRRNEYRVVNNIYQTGLEECRIEILEQLGIKAYIAMPIFVDQQLWGIINVYQSLTRMWDEEEIDTLKQISTQTGLAIQQTEYVNELQTQTQQEKTISTIVDRIRGSLKLKEIFRNATQEVRKLLKCDRVVVYRFNLDWSGEVLAESVGSQWVSVMEIQETDETLYSIEMSADDRCTLKYLEAGSALDSDTYFIDTQGGDYAKGKKFQVVNDVSTAGFSSCYLQSLEKYQAKAYIIVPIFQDNKLWGLFAVYQNSGARNWKASEVTLMLKIAPQLSIAIQQAEKSEKLEKTAKRERGLTKLLEKIQEVQTQAKIFQITTQEARQLLNLDRVTIYRFNTDGSGEFVGESLLGNWLSCLDNPSSLKNIYTYLQENEGIMYQNNQSLAVNDIAKAGYDAYYLDLLQQLDAKAYMIAPIFVEQKLWGLLGAYQNTTTRQWEEDEINALKQVGLQIGVALQKIDYLEQVKIQSDNLAKTLAREKAAKERLQQQAIEMLRTVRPAFGGDLTVRAIVTEDEIGTIAGAYNTTLDSLKDIVIQVQKAVEQVVYTTSDSSVAVEGLSKQSQQQLQELQQALERIQAMIEASTITTQNAQKVEVAIEQANQTVQSGDRAMNNTVESILGIRQTVADAGKRVKRLSESSQKISKVVSLISSFATQTNLLALNAALEATRAGEYGKGFAVVADEVRNLSLQSSEATTEIEKLVREIQEETQEVAAAMDAGVQQVAEGTSLVNETRNSLNAIVVATAEIRELVQGITSAANVQTQQAESVTKVMGQVAEIASGTSNDSRKISSSFHELQQLAQNLQARVAQFKVN